MAKNKSDIVTFLNSHGEEVSNDPRWHAQRTLEAAGLDNSSQVEELHEELNAKTEQLLDKDNEIAELMRQLAEAKASQGVGEEEEEESDTAEDPFSTMNGTELQTFAKENNISIKGLTKVKEVREAIRAAVAAKAE